MAYFPEWSTGSSVFAGNQGNSPIWRELVVHFLEWTTGSFGFAGIQGDSLFLTELVVHLPEWSTSSFDCMEKTTIIAGDFLHTIKTARDNGRFALRLEASATGHGLKAY